MTESLRNFDVQFKNFKLAIEVLIKWKKRAPEGPELFYAVSNLSRASKTFNKLFDDEIIINSCKTINGGGSRFARDKLYCYIHTCDINKFKKCADLILNQYHPSVTVHIFTKCLVDIVKNCTYEFLAQYIDYVISNKLVMPVEIVSDSDIVERGKFPCFKGLDIVKALQISNENGWADKALLLYNHLSEYYVSRPEWFASDVDDTAIRERISENNKLNFDGQLGNQVKQLASHQRFYPWRLDLLIEPKRKEISSVPEEVFDWPIERQPWFFGLVCNPNEDEYIFDHCTSDEAFIVTFNGSKLMAQKRLKKPDPFSKEYIQRTKTKYFMSKEGKVDYIDLYRFYCRLVEQDLDALNSMAGFVRRLDWDWLQNHGNQPNPFVELLANVDSPRDEIVQFLLDCKVPIELNWPIGSTLFNNNVPIIMKLLPYAIVNAELIIQVLRTRSSLVNKEQLKRLISAWNHSKGLLSFALFEYRDEYENHFASIRTLLWIHKFGKSDSCNHLKKLPKELIRIIIGYLGDKPLYRELALMLLEVPTIHENFRDLSVAVAKYIEHSPSNGQIIAEGGSIWFKNEAINYFTQASYKQIRRNYYWIRQAICNTPILSIRTVHRKLINYILKYETDVAVFRHFHRHYRTYIKLDFVEVFKTKNVAALQYYTKERNMFEMPSHEEFEAKIKPPKYTMTYEEAIALAFSANN